MVWPAALTIAGSDSGGGAGVQADVKTFASLRVHGTTVLTCVTAQNPGRVAAVHRCPVPMIEKQLDAVFSAFSPRAVKTGMLCSSEIIRAVAKFLDGRKVALVIDPVMVSTSGRRLLERRALRVLREDLLPLASLITPNLPEAEILLGWRIRSIEAMREAGGEIRRRFGCPALVKGGHLRGLKVAVDIFCDGRQELLLSAPYIKGVRTHGTGCTYSAAITAWLAHGKPLAEAVALGKQYVTSAIAGSKRCAGHAVLNWGRR